MSKMQLNCHSIAYHHPFFSPDYHRWSIVHGIRGRIFSSYPYNRRTSHWRVALRLHRRWTEMDELRFVLGKILEDGGFHIPYISRTEQLDEFSKLLKCYFKPCRIQGERDNEPGRGSRRWECWIRSWASWQRNRILPAIIILQVTHLSTWRISDL